MGASGSKKKEEMEKERKRLIKYYKSEQYFAAYLNYKDILINYIYTEKDISSKEVYLLSIKSIDEYIKILITNEVFKYFLNEEKLNEIEKNLKINFGDYKPTDDKAKIFGNYEDCVNSIIKKDNKFILVDEDFINNFDIKKYKYKNVQIIIKEQINNQYYLTIKYPISEKIINAKETLENKGIFEFYEKEEEKEEKKEDNNIKLKIEEDLIEENEEKKEDKFLSLIKCISNSLIRIDSFSNIFILLGDIITEDKKITKIFFDMIQQKNKDDKLDCSKLTEIIKLANLYEVKNIIEFIFTQIQNEKIIELDDIFNFRVSLIQNCQRCNNISLYESHTYKYFDFSLKNTFLFKHPKKEINILDCFDLLIIENILFDKRCQICSDQIKSFNKIEKINDILIIILSQDINFKEGESFKLDYNINLEKYFQNNIQNKNEYELIGFLSYFPDKDINCSFFKNNNKWYIFKNSNISLINVEKNHGIPFLLFYK